MGLLDDAIKEHLELKRRRGADPTEVDQLEREALGPVRRGPQPADEALLEDEPAGQAGEPLLYDDEAGGEYVEPPELADEPAFADEGGVADEGGFAAEGGFAEEEGGFAEEEPGAAEQPLHESFRGAEHEPFPEDESERGWSHDPAFPEESEHEPFPPDESEHGWSHEAASETPEPAPPEARPEPPSHAGQETVEYDVEAEHGKSDAQEEDVLEETPEFLQDTPDHDRLWFEQRPPRDFDFDK